MIIKLYHRLKRIKVMLEKHNRRYHKFAFQIDDRYAILKNGKLIVNTGEAWKTKNEIE